MAVPWVLPSTALLDDLLLALLVDLLILELILAVVLATLLVLVLAAALLLFVPLLFLPTAVLAILVPRPRPPPPPAAWPRVAPGAGSPGPCRAWVRASLVRSYS